MIHVIILSVIAGALGLYYFFFKKTNLFKQHGIPHNKPLPIIGNVESFFFRRQSITEFAKMMYDVDSDAKYVGMYDFTKPMIVLRDPELIKLITLKHFDTFMDHRDFIDETQDILFGKSLFSLRGDRWRQVRALLTPAFTSSKMKSMFKLMSECGAEFGTYLAQTPPEKRAMEMKEVFSRYTVDVIATCAFGVSVDSMRNPNNDFYVYGREVAKFDTAMFIKFYIYNTMPWLARILKLKFVRDQVKNFFHDLVETTIRTRDEKGIVRPDMLQLLMENRGKEGKPDLTIDDMISQAFVFFFGGFDSTSAAMCFAAHEIAINSDVQETLQNEIDNVLEETNGQAPYDAINNMEYLDAVVNETLRMYPVAIMTDRVCLNDFELPPALPGAKPYIIKKGDGLWISMVGLHHDPKYFEEPKKFDPDRFLGERKKNSLNCGAYLPFGLGPRMCIGNRFSLLETKALLFHLLARCNLRPCEKTSVPIKFAKDGFNMKAEGGFWLNVKMSLFKEHGIPHIKPLPIVGNMGSFFFRRQSLTEFAKMMYEVNPDAKYIGMYDFSNPIIVLRDPELIKLITLKHFDTFMDHRSFIDETQDILFGKSLFSLRGDRWRQVRALLSPAFTSSKMKSMFKLMSECGADFGTYLAQTPPEKRAMEMKEVFSRYTVDVIATCAFGVSVDSMRNPNNDFYVYGREAANFDTIMFIKFFIYNTMPWVARILKMNFVRDQVKNFFHDLVETTIRTRDEKGIVRPDMLQLMMESRGKEGKPDLTIDDMMSQAFVFFFGGFDSTSAAMCFAAHEIAINSDVQETLQNEIDNVLEETNGQAPYDAINNMEYLDAVVNETLRMYPVAVVTDRLCLNDFELPPALPGAKPFTMKKGHGLWIPMYGLQHDPKYFEEPEKFDPDRFLGERKKNSLNCSAYLPFGSGPRMCIGNRFALLETKALLFHLLARCSLKPCEKTSVPIKFAKDGFNMSAEGGFWLNVSPRENIHYTISRNATNEKTCDL
ncbi:Cytochrome P450 9e2 [Ooceraea biroi]|uniref:Cytochrome P450 9e2 n=1 Tax=Ooceraea biroi TaxID=2015173 RepID=A0A026WND2_OOCBI|nr:Cytochrome P450 9e2 [Ooceraea biroi]